MTLFAIVTSTYLKKEKKKRGCTFFLFLNYFLFYSQPIFFLSPEIPRSFDGTLLQNRLTAL